jgi:dihydrofolate synthase / folylpolyglutamate synthase
VLAALVGRQSGIGNRESVIAPLPHLRRLESLGLRNVKLGLEAIDAVCERLGRPERQVPSVLIAGTNGKGSTAATLASIGTAAGLATGLYTSPHLIDVTERIRIGPDDIADGELDATLAEVFAAADAAPAVPLTYFEAMTAAAFLSFAGRKLDLAILEVGLGGRLDATNVAPAAVSVVTSIALDHMADLGDTLAAIAREKAGVFRRGRPALALAEAAEAREALAQAARAAGSQFHDAVEELRFPEESGGPEGSRFRLETPRAGYALSTPLPGEHQVRNASLAVRAAELLADEGARIDARAIADGVAAVRWPGRLERFRVRGKTILLDGCHNPEGAAALAGFLRRSAVRGSLVFGAMADKDIEGIGRALFAQVERICFVAPSGGRAATPEELARRLGNLAPGAATAESVEAAVRKFLGDAGTETIIIAGSLYLVGEARALLLSGRLEERP